MSVGLFPQHVIARKRDGHALTREPAIICFNSAADSFGKSTHVFLSHPLIGTEGYEPLTRGLQAALPFVDDFLPARTLADLGDLAVHLDTVTAGARPRRRQQRL